MEYLFDKVEVPYKNSNDKVKRIILYTNEGKWRSPDIVLGTFEFYKDGTIKFERKSITAYIVSLEELDFIAKCRKEIK